MATTFEVLADPTRRHILDLLLEQPRAVGELVDAVGLSQPGTSKHLRVLRDAGLVDVRKDAQRRVYELRGEPLAELDAWLEPYRRLWAGRLDALERHLDERPKGGGSRPPPSLATASPRGCRTAGRSGGCHAGSGTRSGAFARRSPRPRGSAAGGA